jgi:hypothetical protein
MADWRQIQARIRKAKASSTPAEQLAELYERTRDAMVAFELATFHEKAGGNSDAVKWFTTAAERFRRAQWRVKAEEALTRLGAPIPPKATESAPSERSPSEASAERPSPDSETPSLFAESQPQYFSGESAPQEQSSAVEDTAEIAPAMARAPGAPASLDAAGGVRKRRRRGRRGGRNRRRDGGPGDGQKTAPSTPGTMGRAPARPLEFSAAPSSAREAYHPAPLPTEPEQQPVRSFEPAASQPSGATGGSYLGRMRAGEPALASRMAQLESQLRRMLACQPAALEEADQAPAGPGVLLLSDSDQVTHYYIESCRTLRIGIDNLLRGARGSKGGGQLKELMAENLGIPESRVSKYLKDHCTVRWLQLDEGAAELAHFAIAVLRPVVNE